MSGRILVTGGTGAFGLSTGRWLARAGYDVIAMARRDPGQLPRGVTFTAGDISDRASVRKAMEKCDAVVHLAWVLDGMTSAAEAEPIDIGGTQNVLDAMQDTGCERLVFASSVTAYGAHPDHDDRRWTEDEPLDPSSALVYEWHKARAERMIEDAGVPALVVRATAVVGRNTYGVSASMFRQSLLPDFGGAARMQFLHQDDVGRFLAHAVAHPATGAVNLAAEDTLSWLELAELGGRRSLHTPGGLLRGAGRFAAKAHPRGPSVAAVLELFQHWPIADTGRLTGELGFQPAWSSAEAIVDQGRTSKGYTFLGMKRVRNPTTLDRTVGRPPAFVGEQTGNIRPASILGEFDTRHTDPDLPEWSCANLAEAFPGPMTPLSLELARDVLQMSIEVIVSLLPLDEEVGRAAREKQLGIFGHQVYQNNSVMRRMVVSVPGQTQEDFDHQINGREYPDGWKRPRPSAADVLGMAKFAAVSGPRLSRLGTAVYEIEVRARELAGQTDGVPTMSDAKLLSRIEMLWDDLIRAWQVGNTCTFLVSAPAGMLERKYGAAALAAVSQGAEGLASGATLKGVHELAGLAAKNERISTLLEGKVTENTWEKLAVDAPDFAAAVHRLVKRVGHRGPGETELANSTYADEPHLLLRAVAGVIQAEVRERPSYTPSSTGERRLGRTTAKAIARRERARDAVSLTIHQLRIAVREWGDRLVARGIIRTRDDVFYLTYEELFAVTAEEAGVLVERRRTERAALQLRTMPTTFEHAVDVEMTAPTGTLATLLRGAAVSPGVYRGTVRLLGSTDDEIEPGDVLVARATDTGWTPFFGVAGAVVTEIGAMMSHASIVAREFGIPAVVGVEGVMASLRDGQIIEVDGSQGTVTIVDEPDTGYRATPNTERRSVPTSRKPGRRGSR